MASGALSQFKIRDLLLGLGVALVSLGGVLLIYFVYLVYQVLVSPEDVRLFQYVMNVIGTREPILDGMMIVFGPDGPQKVQFSIKMSEDLKRIVYLVLAVFCSAIAVSIVKHIINGGVSVIKGARYYGVRPKRKEGQAV